MISTPGLWYPAGAGGMWLNYVTWCSFHQTTIPGDHHYFEYPYLRSLNPEYSSFYYFHNHNDQPQISTVVLGSDSALFNFYLNLVHKKRYYKPGSSYRWKDQVAFNLNWCNIFENPVEFFTVLNSLTGYHIKLDQHTEFAIEQYKNSCLWYNLSRDKLHNLKLIQECVEYCFENHTDSSLSKNARILQARDLVDQSLWTRKF